MFFCCVFVVWCLFFYMFYVFLFFYAWWSVVFICSKYWFNPSSCSPILMYMEPKCPRALHTFDTSFFSLDVARKNFSQRTQTQQEKRTRPAWDACTGQDRSCSGPVSGLPSPHLLFETPQWYGPSASPGTPTGTSLSPMIWSQALWEDPEPSAVLI